MSRKWEAPVNFLLDRRRSEIYMTRLARQKDRSYAKLMEHSVQKHSVEDKVDCIIYIARFFRSEGVE